MTKEKVLTLQRIMLEDYDKKLTYAEAEEMGRSLVSTFDMLDNAANAEN